jgi:hypothetical protein
VFVGGFQTWRVLLLRLWSHGDRATFTSLPVVLV